MIYHFPASIYLFKVNNGNTIGIGNHFGIFTTNSEQISQIALLFPLLTLNE